MIDLTITVTDPANVFPYFEYIEVYRADDFDFTENVSFVTTILLIDNVLYYTYNDVTGTTEHWYRSRYWDGFSLYSAWSSPVRGIEIPYFRGATYPVEESYTADEWDTIYKIRKLVGDLIEVERDYISGCYESVFGDLYSYELNNKGWPLKILMTTSTGTIEFATLDNPYVQGYKYLQFTDADSIITQGTTLDVWYSSFIFSDREIKSYYDDAIISICIDDDSPYLEDLLCYEAALTLAETEWEKFLSGKSVRVRDGDTEYDPTPGIRAREGRIAMLKKKRDELIDCAIKSQLCGIEGVRIE
jgi:hypothetical protein